MERQPLELFEDLNYFFTNAYNRHYFYVSDGLNKFIGVGVDKLFRKLSPPLTEQERERRITVARQIAGFLKGNDPYDHISGIYLFGSTEKGGARFSSDIDIAVCIPNLGTDPYYKMRELSNNLVPYLKETKIAKGLKIQIVLVSSIRTYLTMIPDLENENPYASKEPTSLI